MTKFLKPDKKTTQDLSSAALSYTTDYEREAKIQGVFFKFTGDVTETITITLDSKEGATYDQVLRTYDLVDEEYYRYTPDEGELDLQSGDQLKIECTDANGKETVAVLVKSKETR